MKKIVCEICGSNEFRKEGDYFVCEYCNTKYDTAAVQKIMIDGPVNVKVDKTSEFNNYRVLADRYYENKQYKQACEYYKKIVDHDPDDWEALFKLGLCKGYSTSYSEYNISDIVLTVKTTFEIVNKKVPKQEDKLVIMKDVAIEMFDLIVAIEQFGSSQYSHNMRKNDVEKIVSTEYSCIVAAMFVDSIVDTPAYSNDEEVRRFRLTIANAVIDWCSNKLYTMTSYTSGWSSDGNEYDSISISDEVKQEIRGYYNKETEVIKQFDPNYTPPQIKSSGCYIATAIYGSYDCPQVWVLRRYRDYDLDRKWHGRLFIRFYYTVSPTFVKYFGKTALFKAIFKPYLDRKVRKLSEKGFENTPYDDKY